MYGTVSVCPFGTSALFAAASSLSASLATSTALAMCQCVPNGEDGDGLQPYLQNGFQPCAIDQSGMGAAGCWESPDGKAESCSFSFTYPTLPTACPDGYAAEYGPRGGIVACIDVTVAQACGSTKNNCLTQATSGVVPACVQFAGQWACTAPSCREGEEMVNGRCQAQCDWGYRPNVEGYGSLPCLKICAENEFHDANTGLCTCLPGYKEYILTGKCIPICPEGQRNSYEGDECWPVCPDGQQNNAMSGECERKCGTGYHPDPQSPIGDCIPSGPSRKKDRPQRLRGGKKKKPSSSPGFALTNQYEPSARLSFDACEDGFERCHVPKGKSFAWACVDTENDLWSCGGCIGAGGLDCTRLPHVSGVTCQSGLCLVSSCNFGYRRQVFGEGTTCVSDGHLHNLSS